MTFSQLLEDECRRYVPVIVAFAVLFGLFLLGVCQWAQPSTTYPEPLNVWGNSNGINAK